MNTMKFYKVQGGALVTLRVKISQAWNGRGRFEGKTRADACKLARAGGFVRSKRDAMNPLLHSTFPHWGARG